MNSYLMRCICTVTQLAVQGQQEKYLMTLTEITVDCVEKEERETS